MQQVPAVDISTVRSDCDCQNATYSAHCILECMNNVCEAAKIAIISYNTIFKKYHL